MWVAVNKINLVRERIASGLISLACCKTAEVRVGVSRMSLSLYPCIDLLPVFPIWTLLPHAHSPGML